MAHFNKNQLNNEIEYWPIMKCIFSYVKLTGIFGVRLLQTIFSFFVPIKKKRITVYIHERKGYTCNPKYIVEQLKKQDYDIVWVTHYPETCKFLYENDIKVIKAYSILHFWYHFTANVLISNDCLYRKYIKRKDQLYINTWHGGINYKQIGYAGLKFPQKIQMIYFRLENRGSDVYISGSRFFTENTAKSFRYKKDIFLPSGLPRNDIFFQENIELIKCVRKKLQISNEYKVALYAPTFRKDCVVSKYSLDCEKLIQVLEKKTGNKWLLLYRSHYFIHETIKTEDKFMINVSEYEDIQELLLIADIMISDYSSAMWDYSFTGKPCFIYATDITIYEKHDRSFALPIDEWPYPIAENNAELFHNIEEFDMRKYSERLKNHHEMMGSYEKGTATKMIVDLIENYCK